MVNVFSKKQNDYSNVTPFGRFIGWITELEGRLERERERGEIVKERGNCEEKEPVGKRESERS